MTVTLAIAYYAVLEHERNRQAQAVNLRIATRTLNSLFEPPLEPLGPTRAELLRAERSTLLENAKDRWNMEIERAVRSIQNANWDEIREARDQAIAKLLGDSLESTRHGIESAEKTAEANASIIAEKAKQALSDGKEKAAAKASQITKEVPPKVEKLRMEASTTGAGTVNAARGAVRNAVSKGIEKGKELAGKAQDAVGAAVGRVESKEVDSRSEVERALEERYNPKPSPAFEKTTEELLAERYKSST